MSKKNAIIDDISKVFDFRNINVDMYVLAGGIKKLNNTQGDSLSWLLMNMEHRLNKDNHIINCNNLIKSVIIDNIVKILSNYTQVYSLGVATSEYINLEEIEFEKLSKTELIELLNAINNFHKK